MKIIKRYVSTFLKWGCGVMNKHDVDNIKSWFRGCCKFVKFFKYELGLLSVVTLLGVAIILVTFIKY